MRVGQKGGVTTPCDPNEAKNAQKPQARRKNRKKYSNTCDARVITTPYSNPRKESIPPPQKCTESVTATPRTCSLTSGLAELTAGLAELNSWASVALTHCLTHEWEAEGTAGYLSRTPRAGNIRLSPAVTPGRGSRTSDLSQA